MHTTASTSVEQQQQYVWDNIPSEWKQAKKGKVTNLTFSKRVDLQNLVVLPSMEAEFSLEITLKVLKVAF